MNLSPTTSFLRPYYFIMGTLLGPSFSLSSCQFQPWLAQIMGGCMGVPW